MMTPATASASPSFSAHAAAAGPQKWHAAAPAACPHCFFAKPAGLPWCGRASASGSRMLQPMLQQGHGTSAVATWLQVGKWLQLCKNCNLGPENQTNTSMALQCCRLHHCTALQCFRAAVAVANAAKKQTVADPHHAHTSYKHTGWPPA